MIQRWEVGALNRRAVRSLRPAPSTSSNAECERCNLQARRKYLS